MLIAWKRAGKYIYKYAWLGLCKAYAVANVKHVTLKAETTEGFNSTKEKV